MMISFEELMNSVRHQQGGAVSRKWQRQFSSQQRDRLKIGTGRVAFYVCIHLQTPPSSPLHLYRNRSQAHLSNSRRRLFAL